MDSVSKIVQSAIRPDSLPHPPFFKDHHVTGAPVLPAVEAMENLAALSRKQYPGLTPREISAAAFDKFLFLDPGAQNTAIHSKLERLPDGRIQAVLRTKTQAPKAAITRTKEHATMTIGPVSGPAPTLPLDLAAAPEGICRMVAPSAVYAELVPFGRAYRNIVDTLFLGSDGALARVGSPQPPDDRKDLVLGSPYPLDAAFHTACAWGQYARKIVAFPVALDHRWVMQPTNPQSTYFARACPRDISGDILIYDIYLYDRQGNLAEVSSGVRMRDISGGRTQPPGWIKKPAVESRLAGIAKDVQQMAVIELAAVAPFAEHALSPQEIESYGPMAARRKRSYLGARLALKRISRALSDDMELRAPTEINTVLPDNPRPVCPVAGHTKTPYCSVSHDSRFAVAVAADRPIGIDVEDKAIQALRNQRQFIDASEETLLRGFAEGEAAAVLRIWSAKEAAAKALDVPLAQAWEQVRVTRLGVETSRLQVRDLGSGRVKPAVVDAHLFTLFGL